MIAAARYELLVLCRDRRVIWSVLCLAALLLLAFVGSVAEIRRSEAAKEAVAAAERGRWLGQGTKDPHSAAHYAVYVFKPAPALAVLDTGSTAFLGQSVWLEAHHQNDMLHRPQQDASLLQRAGTASPAGLIIAFGPMVIFLLAYAVAAQDRDQGSLRLALGAAVHPARIVAAKVAAVWTLSFALLVLPVSLLAAGILLGGGVFDAATASRMGLWLTVMAFYLGIAAVMGVCVALHARNPRLALAGLFGAWIMLVLVLPRFASAGVEALRPLPSSQSVRQEMLDQAPAYWSAEQAARQEAALLDRYGVKSLEEIANPRMAELDMVERHSHAVFDRVLGRFYGWVALQDRLFSWAGMLSPAIAVQSLSAAVTGTDFSHHYHFITGAERYRRDLVNRMNADGMAHRAHGAERHVNDRRLWSQIPPFTYAEPSLWQAGRTALPSLFALLAWGIAALLLLGLVSRKLKP